VHQTPPDRGGFISPQSYGGALDCGGPGANRPISARFSTKCRIVFNTSDSEVTVSSDSF
jgi:hypothetical protein